MRVISAVCAVHNLEKGTHFSDEDGATQQRCVAELLDGSLCFLWSCELDDTVLRRRKHE